MSYPAISPAGGPVRNIHTGSVNAATVLVPVDLKVPIFVPATMYVTTRGWHDWVTLTHKTHRTWYLALIKISKYQLSQNKLASSKLQSKSYCCSAGTG